MNFKRLIRKLIKQFIQPNILEIERYKWTKEKLDKIPRGQSIIDVGAGEQFFKKYCNGLNYTSQDFGEYKGIGEEGLHTTTWDTNNIDLICDALMIPKEDNYYDNALCTEVLEHTPKPIEVLKEIHRIIKPKGKLILTVPAVSMVHFAPYYYQSGLSKYFFEFHSKEIGFEIDEIKTIGGAFDLILSIATCSKKDVKSFKNKFKKLIFISTTYSIILLTAFSRFVLGNSVANDICPVGILIVLKKL